MPHLAASITTLALCAALAQAAAGPPTAHADHARDASSAGVTPEGYVFLGFVRNPGGFAEFFSIIEVGVENAVGVVVTRPGGTSYDIPYDAEDDRFRVELGAPTEAGMLAGTGAAGDSLWTVQVEFPGGVFSTHTFDAVFEDLAPPLPGAATITSPLQGDALTAAPPTIDWTEPAEEPGIVEVSASIDELDEFGGSIVAGEFQCSLNAGCLTLDPGSLSESVEVTVELEPGVYQARVEYIRVPTIDPPTDLITPMSHVSGPMIAWGPPDFAPPGIVPPETALVAYIGLRSNDFTVLGQTYTAGQFAIGDLPGSRFRLIEHETETLCEYWNGGACTTTVSEFVTDFRLLAYADVIDGAATNAVVLPGANTPGPDTYGGSPVIMSNAEGFINFGHHPQSGCDREHFIGGITEVPAVFTVGDSGPEPRATTWEGCWDDGEAWAGTIDRTITIHGFELLEGHPALGDVQAMRIDTTDARTKDSLTTTRRAPECWETSLWIVEGYGLARIVSHEFKEGYFDWHDNGDSPAYDIDTVTEQWFVRLCLADLAEPFGTLDFSDVLAFLTAFGAQDLTADVAEPFGVLDFSDVLPFLTAFGAGCP